MSRKSVVRRHVPTVLAVTGVVLAAGATGAGAAKLVTSAQIKDNTIQSRDIHNGTIQNKDLKAGAVGSRELAAGAVKSANLDGSVRLGPIASGLVSRSGVLSRASGVPGMTVQNLSAGEYCIAVPGVDAADHVIVLTADYNNDDTNAATNSTETVAEMSSASNCGSGRFRVRTFERDSTNNMTNTNEGFAFVIN